MNRNYYCKVNSQEEADELLQKIKKLDEDVDKTYSYSQDWCYIGFDNLWSLLDNKYIKNNFYTRESDKEILKKIDMIKKQDPTRCFNIYLDLKDIKEEPKN